MEITPDSKFADGSIENYRVTYMGVTKTRRTSKRTDENDDYGDGDDDDEVDGSIESVGDSHGSNKDQEDKQKTEDKASWIADQKHVHRTGSNSEPGDIFTFQN